MKAETISQTEAIPAEYPALDESPAGFPVQADIWQRIEAYTSHRFTAREVTWVIEGKGHWSFPLTPASLTSAEIWNGTAWEGVTLSDGPYGYCLPDMGPYRVTATVGGGVLPEAVKRAAWRLTDYLTYHAHVHPQSGEATPELAATSVKAMQGGELGGTFEVQRPSTWLAKAIQNSGAADLLRPYRRA